jgi:periplasmic copper chaperone A
MHKIFIVAILFTMLTFSADAQTTPSISVENAWARPTTASTQAAAIYLTITDHGAPDRLVAASTPVAGKAELHQTTHEGNVMKMRPVAGLAISQSAPISLAPGGYHIMLTQLNRPLANGQSFPLSLRFETAGTVETTVMVKTTGAGSGMDFGGTGHDMQHTDAPGMTKP